MITNKGKQIVAKYLLGQAPEFASYLAAGCGNKPFNQSDVIDAYYGLNRLNLDFEAFRVPILSKGFVIEDGVEKIVFKAEMPSNQRYQITEVGVFPAYTNSIANQYDSKLLVTFTSTESWIYGLTSASTTTASAVREVAQLASGTSSDIDTPQTIFTFNTSDRIFNDPTRKEDYEQPRFLNKSLMIRGDMQDYYIENSTFNFNFSQNNPGDNIRLAMSLIGITPGMPFPTSVTLTIDFINNVGSRPKARYVKTLTSDDFRVLTDSSYVDSRYIIVSDSDNDFGKVGIPLGKFVKDTEFSWGQVNLVKINAYVTTDDDTSDEYYVCLDGMRLENEYSENPLYSLVGYNVARTNTGNPVVKAENTNNYIEYRFGISVS